MRGVLVVYVNYHPEQGETREDCIAFLQNQNRELFNSLMTETDYRVMFVPTTNEACRVERVDIPSIEEKI